MDGTLGSTNVVQLYLDFHLHGSSRLGRGLRTALFLPRLPVYAALDTVSRDWFCRFFYRVYAGVPEAELDRWGEEVGRDYWAPRLYPKALDRIREHRERGHRIVILSGGIEPVLRPLARIIEPDALVAAQPEILDGRLTGRLLGGPLSGDRKAVMARETAASMGVDVARSYAYADSYSDREILECVGNPVAVNPDTRLRRMAAAQGWQTHQWRP